MIRHIRLWKIGNECNPATPDELKAFKKKLKKCYKKGTNDIVWHHAVTCELVPIHEDIVDVVVSNKKGKK